MPRLASVLAAILFTLVAAASCTSSSDNEGDPCANVPAPAPGMISTARLAVLLAQNSQDGGADAGEDASAVDAGAITVDTPIDDKTCGEVLGPIFSDCHILSVDGGEATVAGLFPCDTLARGFGSSRGSVGVKSSSAA